MPLRWIRDRLERWMLYLVLVVGGLALWFPAPGRTVDHGDTVYVTLAALVFTAGLTVDFASLRRTRSAGWRLLGALAASTVLFPLFAWGLSRLVDGQLRDALLAVGVAPSEVASLALVSLGAGDVVMAAVLVLGSTVITILVAGPILSVLSTASHLNTIGLGGTLVIVVALPLVLGALVGARLGSGGVGRVIGGIFGSLVLLLLIWEVASQVRLAPVYLVGVALLVVFVTGSALIGVAVSTGAPRATRTGIVLPVAIRDFAIAAGIATAAFGAASTGLLGIYGLLVLVLGTLASRWLAHPSS
ncbi:hypothetical protein [Ferrimicrobium sp.]|uniref:hypothetical protein n=1 Tax=Ferrimicrobium sp. TaxID=2926050 RepID=UPI00261B30FD|nr:hypothetical protein [Ferrimicrobium sp.]